jgi:lipopolysaccharide biosynthesis glycosyltransferase
MQRQTIFKKIDGKPGRTASVFLLLSFLLLPGKISAEDKHIFYISDEPYLHPTLVSIASILKNYQTPQNQLNFHIAYTSANAGDNLPSVNPQYIEGISPDISYHINLIPVKNFYEALPKFDSYFWHQSIYLKLYAADILKDIDRCLYLDGDTMCTGDISPLLDFEMDDDMFLAGCAFERRRINAGCVLMNLSAMRRGGFVLEAEKILHEGQEEMRSLASEIKKRSKRIFTEEHVFMHFADNKQAAKFSDKFNTRARLLKESYENAEGFPLIIHFLSSTKPWKYDKKTLKNPAGRAWPFVQWAISEENGWHAYSNLVKEGALS